MYGELADQTEVAVVAQMYMRHDRGGGIGAVPVNLPFFFCVCNSSRDSTVKNVVAQRYHFKHDFSQEPQILSVD